LESPSWVSEFWTTSVPPDLLLEDPFPHHEALALSAVWPSPQFGLPTEPQTVVWFFFLSETALGFGVEVHGPGERIPSNLAISSDAKPVLFPPTHQTGCSTLYFIFACRRSAEEMLKPYHNRKFSPSSVFSRPDCCRAACKPRQSPSDPNPGSPTPLTTKSPHFPPTSLKDSFSSNSFGSTVFSIHKSRLLSLSAR